MTVVTAVEIESGGKERNRENERKTRWRQRQRANVRTRRSQKKLNRKRARYDMRHTRETPKPPRHTVESASTRLTMRAHVACALKYHQ